MNLIPTPTTPPPAELALMQTQSESDQALHTLRAATISGFRRFWFGPVPAADMLAVMGVNACAAFDAHAATVGFVLARGLEIDPDEDYTPPLAYTRHEDGTITLS
jgi:hypothetical protein